MCGIFGYVGGEQASPIIFKALKRLEYRGYDSYGVAILDASTIHVAKGIGTLERVPPIVGSTGIGHVRWATHGEVSERNAHPHISCDGSIAIVHNGIIENYQELKESLRGHVFRSDTDSEVIAHLIEEYLKANPFFMAFAKMVSVLKGSYAIVAMDSNRNMVAAKQESPLVIGMGEGFNVVASDALSFAELTSKVIYLEDGAIVTINSNYVEDIYGNKLVPMEMKWGAGDMELGDYPHYMLKEMMEYPQVIKRALGQEKIIDSAIDLLRARNVLMTACGTSRYAALVGRYAISKLSGKLCEVVMASELSYFSDSINRDTLVLAVSQSGETADINHNINMVKKNGARLISIVNTPGSSLCRASDRVHYMGCGPEVSVAATKTFISELVILYLLAHAMAGKYEQGIAEILSVPKANYEVGHITHRLAGNRDAYYIGRGINFALAGEAALKLKEISYIHAEGMPAGELKHGTLSLVEKGTPVIGICPNDYTYDEMISNLHEAKSRGAWIVGISDRNNDVFEDWVRIPEVPELYYPLVSVVPAQLIAYHTAIARGLNPDRPRNLAKSVTVR